jgi:plastocyanin
VPRDLAERTAVKRLLNSVPLLGLVLFAFSVGFPPFDDVATVDLSVHMVQHMLIIAAGILVAYPIYKKGVFSPVEGKLSADIGALVVCILVAFWHFPAEWDAAVLNPAIHAAEHLSFFAVGFLIGSLLQRLQDRTKIELLALGFFASFFYGWLLISGIQVYPLFSLAQQGELGVIMFIAGPVYWVGVIYLVLRNPAWFHEPQAEPHVMPSSGGLGGLSRFRAITPVLTVLLLIVLVGFYATSAVAVSYAPGQQSARGSVVYIVETPVSWQYSPQTIRVVIGENNTVTWVSHSISYDTITGVNGSFSSGQIAPGQTYTYTFTREGVYEYHCLYHPWMVGFVKVVASH